MNFVEMMWGTAPLLTCSVRHANSKGKNMLNSSVASMTYGNRPC
jgi:hypothetical protein